MKHALYIIAGPPGSGKSLFVDTLMQHHFDAMTVVEIECHSVGSTLAEYETFKEQYKDHNAILCVTIQRRLSPAALEDLMRLFRSAYRQAFSYIEIP